MKSRCPGHTFLGIASVSHYALTFSRWSRAWNSGTADIIPQKGSEVWGVLYDLTLENLRRVDTFADYPHSYERLDILVHQQGEVFPALTYVAIRQGIFAPSKAYLDKMISGATKSNIPESYLSFLRGIKVNDA